MQCSSLQSAINCGPCPNAAADKNVTCSQSNINLHTNHTMSCLFALQTEIYGYLLGERSDYVIVHLDDGL